MKNEQYAFLIEILKVCTPIVALLAMFFTPWFTAKFNKQQKVRDELFSNKVKAYVNLAKIVTETMRDLETIRNNYYSKKQKNSFYKIYIKFKHEIADQSLFTSLKTKKDIDVLYISFHKIYDNELLGEDFEKLIPLYTASIYECKQFILKMQDDIGFTKIK